MQLKLCNYKDKIILFVIINLNKQWINEYICLKIVRILRIKTILKL